MSATSGMPVAAAGDNRAQKDSMQTRNNASALASIGNLERRGQARVECLIEVAVDFNDVLKESVIVRDISATGAKIEVPADLFIPQRFDLAGLIDGSKVRCELVWRKADVIGVKFAGSS